jgi:hypothetical protein
MSIFAPLPIRSTYDFRIERDRLGHWVVSERSGLAGGVFHNREDAFRFALFESGEDASHVHLATRTYSAPRGGQPS